jgi:hypothetical protein
MRRGEPPAPYQSDPIDSRTFLDFPPPPPEHPLVSDLVPVVTLGVGALIVIALCMAIAAAWGAVRLLLGVGLLAAGVLSGFWVWQHGPDLVNPWINPVPAWLVSGMAAAAGLMVFFALRSVLVWIAHPFGSKDSGNGGSKGPVSRAISMVFSLVPAAVLCFLGALLIRHFGSVSELKAYAASQSGEIAKPASLRLADLKNTIDKTLPAGWFERLDPLTNDARLAIAKWITSRPQPEPEPEIDPATGKPIPRAIPVPDPELQKLAREGRYSTLLRDPRIDTALKNPETRRAVRIILAKKPRQNP